MSRRISSSSSSNSEENFEVEKILAHRKARRDAETQYLVKWKGYAASENSWEPESNLNGCEQRLKLYWQAEKRRANSDIVEAADIAEAAEAKGAEKARRRASKSPARSASPEPRTAKARKAKRKTPEPDDDDLAPSTSRLKSPKRKSVVPEDPGSPAEKAPKPQQRKSQKKAPKSPAKEKPLEKSAPKLPVQRPPPRPARKAVEVEEIHIRSESSSERDSDSPSPPPQVSPRKSKLHKAKKGFKSPREPSRRARSSSAEAGSSLARRSASPKTPRPSEAPLASSASSEPETETRPALPPQTPPQPGPASALDADAIPVVTEEGGSPVEAQPSSPGFEPQEELSAADGPAAREEDAAAAVLGVTDDFEERCAVVRLRAGSVRAFRMDTALRRFPASMAAFLYSHTAFRGPDDPAEG